MKLLDTAPYVNIGFKFGMKLFSRYLNFKCGENEFRDPFMNGLQMGVMSAASQDIFELNGDVLKDLSAFEISKKIFTPLLFGFATTADDLMINKGLTSKHYLTDIMSVIGTADLLKATALQSQGLAELLDLNINYNYKYGYVIASGLLGLKYLQEYMSGSKGYIDTTRTLNIKLNKNISNLEYVTNGAVNMKAAVVKQILVSDGIDLVKDVTCKVTKPNPLIAVQATQVIGLIKLISNVITSIAASENGFSEISAKNNKIISSPEALLKISSNDRYSNTFHELDRISNEVSALSTDVLMMNSFLLGVQNLNKTFSLVNLRSSLGEMFAISDTVALQKQLSDITSYMSKSKNALILNPRTIIERSGLEYFVNKNQDMQNKMSLLQDILQMRNDNSYKISILNFADAAIAGLGSLDVDTFTNLSNLSTTISHLPQMEVYTPSLERLTELYRFLDTAENTSYVNYHSYTGKNLYLKDIDINIAGSTKLHMDEMTFEAGKWYLLAGKSGCGKTTFMSALRGLPNFAESIEIKGEAYYPKLSAHENSKIYMLTQTNNFPYGVNMLESVLYPMVTTDAEMNEYKPLVEALMLKMEGYTRDSAEGQEYLTNGLLSRLDERVNDITSETSGGQQKKMSIAGLIVRIMKETGMLDIYNKQISAGKSHDIAIAQAKNSVGSVLVLIDETFNGLDSGANGGNFVHSSKYLVLKTMKESLPSQAIVVSVEHQPQLDQYDAKIFLKGNGTYDYTGIKGTTQLPTEYESFDPLKDMLGDITEL